MPPITSRTAPASQPVDVHEEEAAASGNEAPLSGQELGLLKEGVARAVTEQLAIYERAMMQDNLSPQAMAQYDAQGVSPQMLQQAKQEMLSRFGPEGYSAVVATALTEMDDPLRGISSELVARSVATEVKRLDPGQLRQAIADSVRHPADPKTLSLPDLPSSRDKDFAPAFRTPSQARVLQGVDSYLKSSGHAQDLALRAMAGWASETNGVQRRADDLSDEVVFHPTQAFKKSGFQAETEYVISSDRRLYGERFDPKSVEPSFMGGIQPRPGGGGGGSSSSGTSESSGSTRTWTCNNGSVITTPWNVGDPCSSEGGTGESH